MAGHYWMHSLGLIIIGGIIYGGFEMATRDFRQKSALYREWKETRVDPSSMVVRREIVIPQDGVDSNGVVRGIEQRFFDGSSNLVRSAYISMPSRYGLQLLHEMR